MNNKHNSVLDIQQPPANVELLDTVEDAHKNGLPPSEYR